LVAEFNDEFYQLQRLQLDGTRIDLGLQGQFPRVASTGQAVFRSDQNRENLLEYALTKDADVLKQRAGSTQQTPITRFASSTLDQIPELSPDGKHVAFLSSRGGFDQVWFGALDQANTVPIAATESRGRIGRIDWFVHGANARWPCCAAQTWRPSRSGRTRTRCTSVQLSNPSIIKASSLQARATCGSM
jgi:hypothetical protein